MNQKRITSRCSPQGARWQARRTICVFTGCGLGGVGPLVEEPDPHGEFAQGEPGVGLGRVGVIAAQAAGPAELGGQRQAAAEAVPQFFGGGH